MYVSEVENVMHGSASWKSAEKGRKKLDLAFTFHGNGQKNGD
jgi:hypothetical protein